jgi:hypothetical protein
MAEGQAFPDLLPRPPWPPSGPAEARTGDIQGKAFTVHLTRTPAEGAVLQLCGRV